MKMKWNGLLISILFTVALLCASASAAVYSDTYAHWAGSDVERLAALNIISDPGPFFYPDQNVSRGQALDWIVRMANSGDVSGLAANAASSYPVGIGGLSPQYAGTAAIAVQSGVLSGADVSNLNFSEPALREEVFTWISRALRLQPEVADQSYLRRFVDAASINPLLTPHLIPLFRDGVAAGSGGYFYPQNTMKKGEVASLLNRCLNRYLQPGVNPYAGAVSQTGKITSLQLLTYPNQVTILNLDHVQHTLRVGSSSVITKNGVVTALGQLAEGEPVSYSADATGNLLTLRSSLVSAPPPNPWTSYRSTGSSESGDYMDGEVESVSERQGTLDLLTNSGGKRYTAEVERFERRGSVYYIDDVRIRVGDEVRVYYTDGEIDSVELLDSWTHNANVVSEEVSVYKAMLDGYDSTREQLKLASSSIRVWNGSSWVNVSGNMSLDCGSAGFYDYDGSHLTLQNLREFEESPIYVLYDHEEEEVLTIRVMQGTETMRNDEITAFSGSRLTLNDEVRMYADYTTTVLYRDSLYDIEDVNEDSRVRVLYNRYQNENYAVLIELSSGTSSDADRDREPGEYTVYQATLSYVDDRDGIIALTDLRELDEGRMQSVSGSVELYARDADYYYQGDSLSFSQLGSRYDGYTVLVRCNQDDEADIVTLVSDRFLRSRTADIDRKYSGYLTLRNVDDAIDLDEYTIIMENGNALSDSALYSNNEVFIVYEVDGEDYRALLIEKLDYLY